MENMDFNMFTEQVAENIKGFLPEEYRDAPVQIRRMRLLNREYTGLKVPLCGEVAAPVVNLDALYGAYKTGQEPMERIMEAAAGAVQRGLPVDELPWEIADYEKARGRLCIRLCSTERNGETLKTVPHRRLVGDLAVTYHVVVSDDCFGTATVMVDGPLMEYYGVSPDRLHEDAVENAQKLYPPKITRMTQVLADALGGEEDDYRRAGGPEMLVLSNEEGFYGAGVIFYPGMMEKVADRVGGSYYVLPSSMHETIILPDDGTSDAERLAELTYDINRSMLKPEDFLSDQVYWYDADEKEMKKAENKEG